MLFNKEEKEKEEKREKVSLMSPATPFVLLKSTDGQHFVAAQRTKPVAVCVEVVDQE